MSRLAPQHHVPLHGIVVRDSDVDIARCSDITWRALSAAYDGDAQRQLVVFVDDKREPEYPCAVVTFKRDGSAFWQDVTCKGNLRKPVDLPQGTRKLHRRTMYRLAGFDYDESLDEKYGCRSDAYRVSVYARNLSLYVGRSHSFTERVPHSDENEWQRWQDAQDEPRKLMWHQTIVYR